MLKRTTTIRQQTTPPPTPQHLAEVFLGRHLFSNPAHLSNLSQSGITAQQLVDIHIANPRSCFYMIFHSEKVRSLVQERNVAINDIVAFASSQPDPVTGYNHVDDLLRNKFRNLSAFLSGGGSFNDFIAGKENPKKRMLEPSSNPNVYRKFPHPYSKSSAHK